VAVMREGRIEQIGTSHDVYLRPRSRWVAEFVGDADVLPGIASGGVVECELGRFDATAGLDGAVEVVIRPEHVGLEPAHTGNGAGHAIVLEQSSYGHDHVTHVRLPSGRVVRSRQLGFARWREGASVRIAVEAPVGVLPASDHSAGTAR
jgi:iron(III) transport system ATP-binding protein